LSGAMDVTKEGIDRKETDCLGEDIRWAFDSVRPFTTKNVQSTSKARPRNSLDDLKCKRHYDGTESSARKRTVNQALEAP
jgi:hypothetical protein